MRKTSFILVAASLSLLTTPIAFAQGMGGMDGGMGGMQGMGGGGDMGGGPQGGPEDSGKPAPPRPPKPVKRKQFDKLVTAMFRDADANKDGTVTVAELHSVVEARREATIRARFAAVDANRDGSLSAAEFMTWQKQMGSVASSDAQASGDRNGPIADAILPSPDGEDDYAIAAMIEPLSGTVIAQANINYDAGVSLDELLAYEGRHFDEADKDKDGELSPDELRPVRPAGRGRGPGGPGPGGPGGPPPRN